MKKTKMLCGWCGKVIQEGDVPATRNICKECMGKFIETLKEPPHDKGGDR